MWVVYVFLENLSRFLVFDIEHIFSILLVFYALELGHKKSIVLGVSWSSIKLTCFKFAFFWLWFLNFKFSSNFLWWYLDHLRHLSLTLFIYDAQTIWIWVQKTLATLWDPIFKSLLLLVPHILISQCSCLLVIALENRVCALLAPPFLYLAVFLSQVKGAERISSRLPHTLSAGSGSSI